MEGQIVWFPGHMAKAKRRIKETLPLVDLVIELVDARLPLSSRNPDFKTLFASRPCVTLLTKSTLADPVRTEYWRARLGEDGHTVLAIDCKANPNFSKVTEAILEPLRMKLAHAAARGIRNKPVRCLVAGITNVGKSTFINSYTGTRKAKVEDRPGVTRENQWITAANGIELLDTPGLLWPKFEDETVGIKLAAVGSIRDEILDIPTLACNLLTLLASRYADRLTERYKITVEPDASGYDLLLAIGKARGFLMSGGVIDEDRASVCVLDEFRAGKLGRVTLD